MDKWDQVALILMATIVIAFLVALSITPFIVLWNH